MIHLGDSTLVLKSLADNSVDAVVTDPPYGLKFMNKKWDYDVPSVELWREVLRVLKPGGHLLSFGGTRTYHRMVVAIEDAGFEIRDQVQWIYGSGFPKSLDVSKAIDKTLGVKPLQGERNPAFRAKQLEHDTDWETAMRPEFKTKPASDAAKQWQGWGTALKPANEPIVLARKPLEKGLTVAANVLKWGVGAINVDASRIGAGERRMCGTTTGEKDCGSGSNIVLPARTETHTAHGRWPANVLFDEEAARVLDEQSGERGLSKGGSRGGKRNQAFGMAAQDVPLGFGDSGGASRFFYVAKASKSERNRGLEGMLEKTWQDQGYRDNESTHLSPRAGAGRTGANANHHPTVKPIKLMEYLIKLVTPPEGTVLDPFAGSGTTGVACKRLGFKFLGIEQDTEYVNIALRRIAAVT